MLTTIKVYACYAVKNKPYQKYSNGPRSAFDNHYWLPGGGRLFDMKVVSSYVFLLTYYLQKKVKVKC